ncbi:terminase small subunit [Escherichia coli]|uniref:terminase small subunit n=18 Tax=Escherichia TaxID=561 RepID=UPI00223516E7|nr:terminase small subunit [Escherichia coli]
MEVNKKQLADIFGASIRTIQNWQEQGMPVLRGGGKGNEVLYDSAAVIKWYAKRDAEIENEKLRREVEELRQASEADLQPGTIEYERHRLTRAQADAQELKNARDSAEVVETAFCTFVLSRIAGEIASILDGIPLSVQRRFPELENRHVDFLKRDIIKAMNKAAALDELIWALANDMNCSAGQLLASAASRRLVTQTARTGSIGVMMAHSNYGAALEKQGVEITLIYSGSHKVDGNPYSHLPDDVRETLQSRMDATRQMFAQKVSAYTGLSVQAVLDTEAAVYSGQEAIDAGLADELVNSTDAITVMRDALDARKSRLSGGRMTKETQSTTVSATASQTDVTDVVPATEGENASAAQPDVNAQITAAVAAENSRIMGILNCEEAHGREEQARVLAETPGMTVETARRILAAAPQSAQARSDTALDRLMQGAPAPLAAGNPASDAVNDLLNTPV